MKPGYRLYTLDDLAYILKCHKSTARKRCGTDIPFKKVGGSIRIKPEDVNRYLSKYSS